MHQSHGSQDGDRLQWIHHGALVWIHPSFQSLVKKDKKFNSPTKSRLGKIENEIEDKFRFQVAWTVSPFNSSPAIVTVAVIVHLGEKNKKKTNFENESCSPIIIQLFLCNFLETKIPKFYAQFLLCYIDSSFFFSPTF